MLRNGVVLLLLCSRLLAAETPSLAGRWVVTLETFGVPSYYVMNLDRQGDKLTGDFGGDKLEGTVSGAAIRFLAKDDQGGSEDGTVRRGVCDEKPYGGLRCQIMFEVAT